MVETPTNSTDSKSLIPRKVLFGNPDRVSPQLSPDGKKLSFLAPVNGVLNVWVGPPENPDLAEAVTQDTGRGICSHSWACNNNCLLYVQDQDGDGCLQSYTRGYSRAFRVCHADEAQ